MKVKIDTDSQKIDRLLTRGAEEIITVEELRKKLSSGKPLIIKLGADPTRPDLHLGHAVVLRKLKEFQDLGHKIVFIIGDYTTLIGDPSGRSKTRPQISAVEIKKNAETYFKQVGKILDVKKTEICYNSEWFKKFTTANFINLTSKFTIARILERDDFEKRYKEGIEIGLHEFLYPAMQAHDSIAIKADVEIGGTDQKFNMLAGRELQKKMGSEPQNVITMPLLVGLDGKNKMSKSLDNYIGLFDVPQDMYGKIMSIPDEQIIPYFTLCTNLLTQEIKDIEAEIKKGANPRDFKMRLGREIVTIYHNKEKAAEAEQNFIKQFQKGGAPEQIETRKVQNTNILDVLVETGLAASKGEGRRLIEQGGIKIDGQPIKDITLILEIKSEGMIIQKGKLKYVKIITL